MAAQIIREMSSTRRQGNAFAVRPRGESGLWLVFAGLFLTGVHAPTFARTSARRKRSMKSMNRTDGTKRINAVIEATW